MSGIQQIFTAQLSRDNSKWCERYLHIVGAQYCAHIVGDQQCTYSRCSTVCAHSRRSTECSHSRSSTVCTHSRRSTVCTATPRPQAFSHSVKLLLKRQSKHFFPFPITQLTAQKIKGHQMVVTGGCSHLGAGRVRPSKGDLSSENIGKPGP